MIRLTLLLIAGILGTMYVFGDRSTLPQGSDPGGPEAVAAAPAAASEGPNAGLLTRVSQLIDSSAVMPEAAAERIPLADEKRAIEIALAASVSPDEPQPAPTRTVTLTASGAGQTAQVAPAVATTDGRALWVVTGSRVNLRAGPSTSDSVVGQVVEGERAEVVEETADGWFRIETEDGSKSGFIFGRFLSPLDAG